MVDVAGNFRAVHDLRLGCEYQIGVRRCVQGSSSGSISTSTGGTVPSVHSVLISLPSGALRISSTLPIARHILAPTWPRGSSGSCVLGRGPLRAWGATAGGGPSGRR